MTASSVLLLLLAAAAAAAAACCCYCGCSAQGRAYEYGLETLRQQGVPVEGLRFDPGLVIRGLIMDKEYGNLIKVDRFG
jgi:hypothetical protein